jgi:hypothetical protein
MLADSGDMRFGLPPLRLKYAGNAVLHANDHNATLASRELVGRSLHKNLQRATSLAAFLRVGYRVWVHSLCHRMELSPHAVPGASLVFSALSAVATSAFCLTASVRRNLILSSLMIAVDCHPPAACLAAQARAAGAAV